MKIEILYIEGCPNHLEARNRVCEVLAEENIRAEVLDVRINDREGAIASQFLGSPTIRVDGLDIEAAAKGSDAFGMMCRTYEDRGQRAGLPPRGLIRAALREISQS